MFKRATLLLTFFLALPLIAGEIRITVPKGASVTIEGQEIKFEGTKHTVNFNDENLDPNLSYTYTFKVTVGDVVKEKKVVVIPRGTVAVDFTSEFRVANQKFDLAAPRVATQLDLEKKMKAVAIPDSIKHLEPLSDLYAEYLTLSGPLSVKELNIGEFAKKITCSVWSIEDKARHFDSELVLENTKSGKGRFVNVSVQNFLKDFKHDFLLTNKENFWRGKDTREPSATATLPWYDLVRLGTLGKSISGAYYLGPLPIVTSENYVCLSKNSNHPLEFYLELGVSHSFSAKIDNTSKDIASIDTVRQRGFTIQQYTTHNSKGEPLPSHFKQDTPISWETARDTALNRYSKLKTGVPGFCYKATPEQVYTVKGIGICTIEEPK